MSFADVRACDLRLENMAEAGAAAPFEESVEMTREAFKVCAVKVFAVKS